MSLTSCFKYAIELPESTLTQLLRSVIAQADTAELPLTYEDTDVPVDGYTARISARLIDSDDRPSAFEITAVDLEAVLHLHMDIEVTIQDLAGLDPILYEVDFDLPGDIVRNDAAVPVQIEFQVGAVNAADLNLVVSGGDLVFTAELFEPFVDQLYSDNLALHEFIVPGVDTVIDGVVTVQATLHNNPTDGEITVELPVSGTLRVNFPASVIMYSITGTPIYDFPITISVDIDYEVQATVGGRELVVKISEVQNSDVSVTYGPGAPVYQALMTPFIQTEVVNALAGIGDIHEPVPSDTEVETRIGEALVDFATDLDIPLFPLDPTASSIPIDTAIPTTVDGAVLALQIEDEPGEPCEGPDDFTQASPVAIAMGAPEVQRRLDTAADGIDGEEIEVEGYDVTLHRPTVTLANAGEHDVAVGHIWVEGSVTVHVGGCVGDVGADYFGPLMLNADTNPDQTIVLEITAGTFGGDADVKDKKDEFDPDAVADYIEGWNFDLPTIPSTFEGVGTLVLAIDTVDISRDGIVLRGGVEISLLHGLMIGSILPTTLFWAYEGAGGG